MDRSGQVGSSWTSFGWSGEELKRLGLGAARSPGMSRALASDVRQRFLQIIELIEKYGLDAMHEPHIKHSEGQLWEMRMKGKDGIARAIHVTATERRVIVMLAFAKKTPKRPARALEIARARAKEVATAMLTRSKMLMLLDKLCSNSRARRAWMVEWCPCWGR